uniref:Major facilitator superfamily (MFS) profile domain-containing protein n=1 Tax=Aplanochytrium stocchinoi TaxID=215587 RepID=A0A7S3PJ65_9STRA|mmetsp:Transcript_18105/g.22302  ORF Transcript_18105/g.22302 Transcript_18105/m.22302 type:complete len:461 (-) Transcript_18105:638-2020(-)
MFLYILLFLAASLENGDEVLVPASFDAIGKTLGVSVALLGSLTFGRSFLQAVGSIFIVPFVDVFPKLTVLGLSCAIWGVCTLLTGLSMYYYQLLIFRTLTGVCLAFSIPTIRSFMSSDTSKRNRAKGFSLLYAGSNIGALFWGIVATSYAEGNLSILGQNVEGWRLVFVGFAIFSLILGVLIVKMDGSNVTNRDTQSEETISWKLKCSEYYNNASIILRKKTFLIIALQGVVGSMPWKAFSYLTLILKRANFSGERAAFIVGSFQIGVTLGNLLGGYVADALHSKFPNKGYILTAQISAASQLPLSYLCLRYFPHEESYFYSLCASFFMFGLFISWCGSANNSMFSEICPEHMRNAVYALNYAVEGSISSAIIPIVGWLSDKKLMVPIHGDPLSVNVFFICVIASLWLLLVYSLLYSPYAREKEEVDKCHAPYTSITVGRNDGSSTCDGRDEDGALLVPT